MKSYLKSKTFWAATVAVILETLQALAILPFITEEQGRFLSILLVAFIAINRAVKR